jgi:hypothetical protein
LADVVHEAQETCSKVYSRGETWKTAKKRLYFSKLHPFLIFFMFVDSFQYLDNKIGELERVCEKELKEQGFDEYVK